MSGKGICLCGAYLQTKRGGEQVNPHAGTIATRRIRRAFAKGRTCSTSGPITMKVFHFDVRVVLLAG